MKTYPKIQEQLEKEGLDVMLLSAPENILCDRISFMVCIRSLFRPVCICSKEGTSNISSYFGKNDRGNREFKFIKKSFIVQGFRRKNI